VLAIGDPPVGAYQGGRQSHGVAHGPKNRSRQG
jgi:hypothetical protein